MTDSNSNTTGIVLMCVAMGLFAANDTLVKLIADTLSVPQIMALRGVFVCVLTLVWVIAAGYGRSLTQLRNPLVLLRSALEAMAGVTFFTALANLQIAELTAILLITPLLIAAGAVFIYGEKISRSGWAAIFVGFIGMLLVVKPGTESFTAYTFVGVLSAVAIAARDLLTRRINSEVSSLVVCFAGGLALFLLGFAMTAGAWAAHPLTISTLSSGTMWLGLFIAAIVVTLGNYGVILAFRQSSVSVVSPFRYSSLLWAMLAGLVIWHEVPDALALAGSGLIMGSGLYLLQRERIGRRRLAKDSGEAPALTETA